MAQIILDIPFALLYKAFDIDLRDVIQKDYFPKEDVCSEYIAWGIKLATGNEVAKNVHPSMVAPKDFRDNKYLFDEIISFTIRDF